MIVRQIVTSSGLVTTLDRFSSYAFISAIQGGSLSFFGRSNAFYRDA